MAINNAGEVVYAKTHWYSGHNVSIGRSDGLTDDGVVPEPASASLILAMALLLHRRRRD